MTDRGGATLELADLIACEYFEAPLDATDGATPVAKGSPREQVLLAALRAWIARQPEDHPGVPVDDLERLRDLIGEIPRRIGG